MRLRWAIIPTAGRGTRLRPASDLVPKVLLPVGLRPMLDWALDEALASAVENIVVVVGAGHQGVRELCRRRVESGPERGRVRLHIVEQRSPDGLGDALIRCRRLTGDDSFGVVVPDNWFAGQRAALAQVAETHERTGLCTIGLVEVTPARARLLGNVGRVRLEPLEGPDFRILRLGSKRPGTFEIGGPDSVLRGCARYVLGPRFYDALEATGPPPQGEWDDVPAFQRLARDRGLAGRRLDGHHFDVGHEAGYLAAQSFLFERSVSGGDG